MNVRQLVWVALSYILLCLFFLFMLSYFHNQDLNYEQELAQLKQDVARLQYKMNQRAKVLKPATENLDMSNDRVRELVLEYLNDRFEPEKIKLLKERKVDKIPFAVHSERDRVAGTLSSNNKLKEMFSKCYVNTLETTMTFVEDTTTFIITGDIGCMWLRDSVGQVHQYLPLAHKDLHLQVIFEGLIRRQMIYIQLDPYANSFNLQPNMGLSAHDKALGRTEYVATRNYELDSHCYFLQLSYQYWKASGNEHIFDQEWKKVLNLILDLWKSEQDHWKNSPYRYIELSNDGRGSEVAYTGMTWSGYRPSDDACMYHYLIPSNMFAVVVLGYVQEIAEKIYRDTLLYQKALTLQEQIDDGIHKHGVVDHAKYGKIYAYETDGKGNHNLMDDANVPSLLSILYLGYRSKHDLNHEITNNTRKFILSSENPYFFEGKHAKGIGSPHTQHGTVWPMSLIMQGLTSDDPKEIAEIIKMLLATDAGTNFMHESFNPNVPEFYSRSWFAWANSLFSEFIIKKLHLIQP